jgi:hypothetical protein
MVVILLLPKLNFQPLRLFSPLFSYFLQVENYGIPGRAGGLSHAFPGWSETCPNHTDLSNPFWEKSRLAVTRKP